MRKQERLLTLTVLGLIFISFTVNFHIKFVQAIYTPTFNEYNIKEQMILTPIFTPDNALETIAAWIRSAQFTLDIENQYILQFNESKDWNEDPSPIAQAIAYAKGNGVNIRVLIREDADDNNFAGYCQSLGIPVRYTGDSAAESYISLTHNKYICIDNETVIISSINFGENAFTNNREAGMVIQNQNVANYFTSVFTKDWIASEVLSSQIHQPATRSAEKSLKIPKWESHTNFPAKNFTGTYNATLFVNPDTSDEVIFKYLESAQLSIYVSMYTISRPKFNETLIKLKEANPSLDIKVLISRDRVSSYEDRDTIDAAESLVNALIPVWNSTSGLRYYHNKYWIIDGKHTFVYSGNWSPRSASEKKVSYSSGDINRDYGVAILDAPDIAQWYTWMFFNDTEVGSAWELPVGVKVTHIVDSDVLDGTITIGAQTAGEITNVQYRWDSGSWHSFGSSEAGIYSDSFDTTTLTDGIHIFEVKGGLGGQMFSDSVTVTVCNDDTWKVLITEVLYNPTTPEEEKEFFEISNTHTFEVFIGNWVVGDDKTTLTLPKDATIESSTSIIIARDKTGFKSAFGVDADYEAGIKLANTADYVFFQNAKGEYIDVVAWGMEAPDGSEAFAASAADGQSVHRSDFTVDTDSATDFELSDPDPKGQVRTETEDEITSVPIVAIILGVISIMILGQIRKKRRVS